MAKLHLVKLYRVPCHLYLFLPQALKPEIESTIEQAYKILQDDISAPADLELRRQYLGPDSTKPPEERFFFFDC